MHPTPVGSVCPHGLQLSPAGLGGGRRGGGCSPLVHVLYRSLFCIYALPSLSLSLADSLRPDLIQQQPSKNSYSMFQENRCPLRSGENRGSPWPGDFAGVTQTAGGRAGVTILASVLFLSFPGTLAECSGGCAALRLPWWSPREAMWGWLWYLPGACNIFELSPQMSLDLANSLE